MADLWLAVPSVSLKSAEQQWQANGVEVTWRLRDEGGLRALSFDVNCGMFDLDLALSRTKPGQAGNNCHMRYAGKCAEARKELIVEALSGICVLVTFFGKVDAGGHQLICGHGPVGG